MIANHQQRTMSPTDHWSFQVVIDLDKQLPKNTDSTDFPLEKFSCSLADFILGSEIRADSRLDTAF